MTTFYPNFKTLAEYRDYILLAKPNLNYINDSIGEKHGSLVFILPSNMIDLDDKEPIQYSFEAFIILRDTGLAGYQEGKMIFDTSYHLITKGQYSEQIIFLEYRHGEKTRQIILNGDSAMLLGDMFSESGAVKVEYISHAMHDEYEND